MSNGKTLAFAQGLIHILAVGASDYAPASGFAKLKVCAEDARRVAQSFEDVRELNADPSQIRLLISGSEASARPTGGYIRTAIHHLAESATSGDRILFFFSGHGTKDQDELCLVPEDGHAQHSETLLRFRDVLKTLSDSDAKNKLVVLDACLSGPTVHTFKSSLSGVSQKFLKDYLSQTAGTVILASSTEDQPSTTKSPDPKVSLFTHFFVNALRGNPEAMDGRLLTLQSLYDYVSVNVVKTSKSYGTTQQPTLKYGGTGIIVLGDFSKPLLSATANDLVPVVNRLEFEDRRNGKANAVLTGLTYTARHKAFYIENMVNENLGEAFADHFGQIRATMFRFFNASEVKLQDDGVDFPGGQYRLRYEADDVKNGFYIYTARFDSDWLGRTQQMLSLLKTMQVTNPDAITFGLSRQLDPESCIPKLQAAGCEIVNARGVKVEAESQGYHLIIQPDSVILTGFTPRQLFGEGDDLDESALQVTGLIRELAS